MRFCCVPIGVRPCFLDGTTGVVAILVQNDLVLRPAGRDLNVDRSVPATGLVLEAICGLAERPSSCFCVSLKVDILEHCISCTRRFRSL